MLILRLPLWITQTNAYVVATETGGPALLIDAPPDPDPIAEILVEKGLAAVCLLITHGHVDHVAGSRRVAAKTGAAVYVHPADDFLTLHQSEQLRALFGMVPPGDYEPAEDRHDLSDGQIVETGGIRLEVRHTPGHTPGHCCFYDAGNHILYSGDQLFAGSIGRTDLPGGSLPELLDSMRRRVLDLPDDVRVLPGHGPETTIGRERISNPFLADLV